jgi:NitT/TauT family transport system permease protein
VTVQTSTKVRTSHPQPKPSLRIPRPNERLVFGLLGFLIILPIWEIVVQLGYVKRVTLSAPSVIVTTFIEDLTGGVLWPHLAISGQEFVLGLSAALLTGIPIGLALGMSRRLNFLFDPWLSAIYATPTVALIPLVVLILGLGLPAKVFIVWLEAIFVIVVSVISGVRAADQRHLDLAKSFGASRWLRFKSVVLPTSFPFMLTGVRLGATRAIVGVVVAEFFAANAGIGFFINFSGTTFRTDRVYEGVILLGILGILIGECIRRVERRFERWRPQIN